MGKKSAEECDYEENRKSRKNVGAGLEREGDRKKRDSKK